VFRWINLPQPAKPEGLKNVHEIWYNDLFDGQSADQCGLSNVSAYGTT